MATKIRSSKQTNTDFSLNKYSKSESFIDRIMTFFQNSKWAIPLTLILSIVPLIVFLQIVKLSPEVIPHWTTDTNYDFFSYHKVVWLSFLTIISLFSLFFKYISQIDDPDKPQKIKEINLFYYMGFSYIAFAFISMLYSSYRQVALWGFADRYEGFFVLSIYMLLFMLAYSFSDNEDALKLIITGLFTSALILTTIGIFQFFGLDFFKSIEGKLMILPSEYKSIADSLQFQFGAYTIYSTLYNTNYVGSYAVMLFMISFTLFFLTKNKYLKIFLGLFTALMFSNWIGCLSRAGMVGGFAAFILFLIILRKELLKQYQLFIIMLILFFSIFFIMNKTSNNMLLGQVSRINAAVENAKMEKTVSLDIKDLSAKDNTIQFTFNTGVLNVSFKQGSPIIFSDINNNNIEYGYSAENGGYVLKNESFKDLSFKINSDNGLIQFLMNAKVINFVFTDKLYFVDRSGKTTDIKKIESFGFKGREKLASSRGYIWSRTFPLLKHTLIKGFGPDTYSIFFPQNDYLGKLIGYGDPYIIVDKPHNMYLQIAVNTGILSLICILIMFIYYFITSIKMYFINDYSNFYSKIGAGIFMAFFGYCVTAVFNDSLVSVAPVFWILFGLGISCNFRQKKI